ncbi:MAG: metal ABC transporter solute-binding protein, Zn/Mn family [Phycisphaerales bacterium]
MTRQASRDPRAAGPSCRARRAVARDLARALGAACLMTLALLTSACGKPADPGARGTPSVVCTTGMIGDAVRVIAGDRVRLTTLMGEGVDPHLYKPSPIDIRTMSEADLVLYNGLHLEGRMGDVLEQLSRTRAVRAVSDQIDPALLRTPPEFAGQHDPHIWFDVSIWSTAVRTIADRLAELQPAHAQEFRQRAQAYLNELDDLHRWCGDQIATIPESHRVLVTAHDAFGYFSRAYHIEVRSIQGVSTDSEAGVRTVNELVDFIVAREIPAVFVESSVPPKTIQALVEGSRARGHAIRIGGELFSDAMGRAGTPEGTYIGMVRHNVSLIASALSRGAESTPRPGDPHTAGDKE